MKLLHLQPVSTILVATSVAAKPANSVDYQVRSLRLKEDAPDAPFIGPLSAPHEVSRQLSHEPSSLLEDPSDDHRVLGTDTDADSKRFKNPPTRALVLVGYEQGKIAKLAPKLNLSPDVAKRIDDLNPDIYYDVEVEGDVNMYSDHYTTVHSMEKIPYPNGNVQFRVHGFAVVKGTPDRSVFGVHATNGVALRGTGKESKLKVHSDKKVYVFETGKKSTVEVRTDYARVSSVGSGSTVDVYSEVVEVFTNGRYTEVTKEADQFVIVKPGRWNKLNFSVASFPPVDNQIPGN